MIGKGEMTIPPVIGVVDDEPAQRRLLEETLQRAGWRVLCGEDGRQAVELAPRCGLMLLDVRMPGMSGLEALDKIRQLPRPPVVVLLTAYIDVRDAVAAIKMGAADYLEKPVDLDELLTVIEDCLGLGHRDQDALDLPPGIVAESETLRNLFRQAFRVAPTSAAVLLTGESGTGKEIFARLIHARSNRASGPMVTVNMGAVPEQLAESELFGHEKGAFTGADTSRAGRFEEADGGTLFLDEIGELPLSLQPKLLRVLETGEFRRIGGTTDRRANVRVIAATNRDLEREVTAGRFREDLFYRLNVFPLRIPPLRERREDIIPLAELFLGPWKKRLSPAAARLLAAWSWPGNARELRNVVERAAILADGDMILPEDLPDALRNAPRSDRPDAPDRPLMEEAQRRAIREALEKTGGNRTKAAQLLGISRRSLIYKLRAYGL